MPEGAAWLLDTNILLRMSKSDDAHHPAIRDALRILVAQGARLCFTSQILGEFWNASTRPRDQNGFGLSAAETARIASAIDGGSFSSRMKSRGCRSMTPGWPQRCTSTASRNC
jgi:predicted nucleic acid-binding protein